MKFILFFSSILLLPLQVDIEKKLEEAPSGSYQIGVVIGTYLPFVLLVIIAYVLYNRAKKRNQD